MAIRIEDDLGGSDALGVTVEGTPDKLYAFRDTGTGFETLWSVAARTEAGARHAATPDGGVTMISPEGRLQIRDQLTGALRAESPMPVLAAHGFTCSMVTVDARGRLFHNNSLGAGGSAADLRVFDSALQPEWSLSITGVSQGGPSVASDGSGIVDGLDLAIALASWGA